MFYKDSMLVYAVFDSSSDYELIFTSNNLNEACEYLVGSILKSLKLCSSMEIPITNPNFSNFRIDVLKMGLNTRKTDTIYLDDFLLVSENNQLINHNGSILQELQEMKDLCKGKIKSRTKNNKNLNQCNKQKFMNMQQRINMETGSPQKQGGNKKNSITSGYDFLKNRKSIKIENPEVKEEIPKNRLIPDVLEEQKRMEKEQKRMEKENLKDSNLEIASSYSSLDSVSDLSSDIEDFEDNNSVSSEFLDSELVNIEDPEQLLEMVEELKKAKDLSKDSLKELKKKLKKDSLNLSEYNFQVTKIRHDLEREKERLRSEENVFESERRFTYPKIKHHIESGESSKEDIPDMFLDKYPIFEYMEENDLLFNENAFEIYKSLYRDLHGDSEEEELKEKEEYVPHNINYMNNEEKMKFINSYKNKQFENKKVKPLDDILNDLDKLEQEDSNNSYEENEDDKDVVDNRDDVNELKDDDLEDFEETNLSKRKELENKLKNELGDEENEENEDQNDDSLNDFEENENVYSTESSSETIFELINETDQ